MTTHPLDTGQEIEDFDGTVVLDAARRLELFSLLADSALNALRAERDGKLKETDWWVLPDRTPTQAQLDYRQALRDITNTYSSPNDVVWPEKPA